MTQPRLRFNKICLFEHCSRWAREDDILCVPDYRALPERLQRGLWSKDPTKLAEAIEAALQWLQDKRDNVLLAGEEEL